jgi:uncharacterized protein YoxC
MDNNTIIVLVGFIATLIAVITPIIKLNSSITRLNVTMENLDKNVVGMKEVQKEQDGKIQDHEKRIFALEKGV